MNGARRTLGRWLLAAFLEKGCDPTTAVRAPSCLPRVRLLSRRELDELHPLPSLMLATNVCSLALWAAAHGRTAGRSGSHLGPV